MRTVGAAPPGRPSQLERPGATDEGGHKGRPYDRIARMQTLEPVLSSRFRGLVRLMDVL